MVQTGRGIHWLFLYETEVREGEGTFSKICRWLCHSNQSDLDLTSLVQLSFTCHCCKNGYFYGLFSTSPLRQPNIIILFFFFGKDFLKPYLPYTLFSVCLMGFCRLSSGPKLSFLLFGVCRVVLEKDLRCS